MSGYAGPPTFSDADSIKFLDVSTDAVYYDSVVYVTKHGYMTGDPSGDFNPNKFVVYAEALVIILDFLGIPPSWGMKYSIPDIEDFNWCKGYIYSCLKCKICSPSDLSPKRLTSWIDWNTFEQLMENARQVRPLLAPHKKKTNKNVQRIPRAILAHALYTAAKNTALNLFAAIDSSVDFSETKFLIEDYYFALPFLPSDITKIFELVANSSMSEQSSDYSCLLRLYSLKKPFMVSKDNANSVYHYTSLHALEKLSKPGANFRLSNTAYLNDPEEGKLAPELIPDILKGYERLSDWKLEEPDPSHIPTSNTFIASFMQDENKLEMWAQYGDRGSGCCLGFPTSAFIGELYYVFYDKTRFVTFFEDVCKVLDDYMRDRPDTNIAESPIFSYATDTVKQISYLYKDDAYDYEKEVRILSFCDPKDARVEDSIRTGEAFPRLYTELSIKHNDENLLPFSSILLGPKVHNPEVIAVSLVNRGFDNKIIQKSKTKFR